MKKILVLTLLALIAVSATCLFCNHAHAQEMSITERQYLLWYEEVNMHVAKQEACNALEDENIRSDYNNIVNEYVEKEKQRIMNTQIEEANYTPEDALSYQIAVLSEHKENENYVYVANYKFTDDGCNKQADKLERLSASKFQSDEQVADLDSPLYTDVVSECEEYPTTCKN